MRELEFAVYDQKASPFTNSYKYIKTHWTFTHIVTNIYKRKNSIYINTRFTSKKKVHELLLNELAELSNP